MLNSLGRCFDFLLAKCQLLDCCVEAQQRSLAQQIEVGLEGTDLTKVLDDKLFLAHGVRFLLKLDGSAVNSLDDLVDEGVYVCSSVETLKRLDYLSIKQRYCHLNLSPNNDPLKRRSLAEPRSSRAPAKTPGINVPKRVYVFLNGPKPRQLMRLLLDERSAQSFTHVLDEITKFFSPLPGPIRKIFDVELGEVIDLLNSLYTEFDTAIENFDAYKVETIGDAYMVASGLPKRNGNKHAGELASLALSLMKLATYFQLPRFPGRRLLLRVGIHSVQFPNSDWDPMAGPGSWNFNGVSGKPQKPSSSKNCKTQFFLFRNKIVINKNETWREGVFKPNQQRQVWSAVVARHFSHELALSHSLFT
ncbi:hypothetical protein BV898_18475 [Hypsibius exemplaris]|uniref:Guanylate cyclase domain-containing protein n=1 Tax=Hypsibius exemplaris TaxID=2072580 RepID=A0A9X6NK22_HYPEX|nr:hypothetical protein BV898_18475 [Hypsibius exemplaris]